MIDGWAASLPDLSQAAISRRLKVGDYTFQLLVSNVLADPSGEPDTDLIQLMVLLDGQPLTLHDLGAAVSRCSTLWAFLCSRLTELTVDFYAPRPRPDRDLNPRLGCWGTRPDLRAEGRDDDGTLAVVVGISTWRVGARPRGAPPEYVRETAQTLAEVLAYWVLTVERDRRATPSSRQP